MPSKSSRLIAIVAITFIIGFAAIVAVRAGNHRTLGAADFVIVLKDGKATPSAITAKVGQSVEFATKDFQQHDIGQGSGDEDISTGAAVPGHTHNHVAGGIESGVFGRGQSYRLVLSKAGTYAFHDHLHPSIDITIIAYQPTGK